jgi:choice-of-anchor B domain-containing protein
MKNEPIATMKLAFLSILCLLLTTVAPGQHTNIELLANVNQYPNSGYNDVWGYVDSSGIEYAILGVRSGTAVYSLENPKAPVRRAFVPGASSIWRDMKSYAGFVYAVADQGTDGILILDMRKGPQAITHQFYRPATQDRTLDRCHNLYIDEKGVLYLSGCNLNGGGVILYDVASKPGSPQLLGLSDPRYSHDCYARGDTLWSADVYDGFFSVTDTRNKSTPRLLATQKTSSSFTHNCWLSDDGTTLFTTDEKTLGTVDAYDIRDLNNIRFLDRFLPSTAVANRAIPHNVHYYKGFLATSWYTEGVVITDAQRPGNLVEVGRYDTYAGSERGFYGCWGAFPFLPSGILLASDIQSGLYVLQPKYQRACYLEGSVRDASSNAPIAGASIQALGGDISEQSDAQGVFRGGRLKPGLERIVVSAPGYRSDTLSVELQSGVLSERHVRLQKESAITSTAGGFAQEGYAIRILPNPCPEPCRIEWESPTLFPDASLEIWSAQGKWMDKTTPPGTAEFSQLPPGWYVAILRADGAARAVKPFIKL